MKMPGVLINLDISDACANFRLIKAYSAIIIPGPDWTCDSHRGISSE